TRDRRWSRDPRYFLLLRQKACDDAPRGDAGAVVTEIDERCAGCVEIDGALLRLEYDSILVERRDCETMELGRHRGVAKRRRTRHRPEIVTRSIAFRRHAVDHGIEDRQLVRLAERPDPQADKDIARRTELGGLRAVDIALPGEFPRQRDQRRLRHVL